MTGQVRGSGEVHLSVCADGPAWVKMMVFGYGFCQVLNVWDLRGCSCVGYQGCQC